MARRKNVKRIDPRYFLHETVNRNDDGSAREELEEGGIGQYLRKKLGPEDHSRSGDAHLRHAVTGDYKDPLDPSSTDRLAYEKHPALYADRETLGVKRGEKLPYSKARELFKKSLQKEEEGLEEEVDEDLEEEEIEEGFKDFVQGAKDTFRDITKGRKLGKTRQIRKDKEAALDYEAGRADREKEYERDRRAREAEDARSGDAISNVFGGSKAKARIARQDAEDRADRRQRADTARRRQKVKDDIQADKWKNRSRLRNQEVGEID